MCEWAGLSWVHAHVWPVPVGPLALVAPCFSILFLTVCEDGPAMSSSPEELVIPGVRRPGHALYLPTFVKLKSSRSSKRPASGLRRGEASSPCPWTGGQTGGPAGSLVFHHLTCVTDVGPLVFGCFCAFLLQGLSGILASCIEQPCILWWLGLNCLCLLFFLYNPDFNR